jgi:hypothetical protein
MSGQTRDGELQSYHRERADSVMPYGTMNNTELTEAYINTQHCATTKGFTYQSRSTTLPFNYIVALIYRTPPSHHKENIVQNEQQQHRKRKPNHRRRQQNGLDEKH